MSIASSLLSATSTENVVTCKILINGKEITNELTIYQLTVNKSFNKIAFAKIVLMDGTVASRDFILSNGKHFKPGNKIIIQLGFDQNAGKVFEGIIIKHGIKIRQIGSSLLIIEAKDQAIKLTGARKSKYFNNKTDTTILKELAAGLSDNDIEDTKFTHPQMVQFDCTDWDFIVTRAEANGLLVLTDDGKLIAKKPALSTPVLNATYGLNIWEFEAELDSRRNSQSVKGNSWDYAHQIVEKSNEGLSAFTLNSKMNTEDPGKVLEADVTLSHTGNLTKPQLQNWANAYSTRNQISKAVGRLRVQGNANVKPGSTIHLKGVGDRFNGDVFVTGILHHFEGAWQTDIQFGWREEMFYKKEDVMEQPASGLLPGINGLLIGTVLKVDDTENGGQYRVQVHVPMITSGKDGIWARVATLDAGKERGVYFRPQKEDEVVLGFLNDDPREPIILGYLHSKDLHKSPFIDSADNLEYGFVTKEKVKVIFDDTHKRLTLSIKTDTGEKSIVLNTDSNAIELKDENTNTIKMDSDGITIESIKGDVVIKGKNVKIN